MGNRDRVTRDVKLHVNESACCGKVVNEIHVTFCALKCILLVSLLVWFFLGGWGGGEALVCV